MCGRYSQSLPLIRNSGDGNSGENSGDAIYEYRGRNI